MPQKNIFAFTVGLSGSDVAGCDAATWHLDADVRREGGLWGALGSARRASEGAGSHYFFGSPREALDGGAATEVDGGGGREAAGDHGENPTVPPQDFSQFRCMYMYGSLGGGEDVTSQIVFRMFSEHTQNVFRTSPEFVQIIFACRTTLSRECLQPSSTEWEGVDVKERKKESEKSEFSTSLLPPHFCFRSATCSSIHIKQDFTTHLFTCLPPHSGLWLLLMRSCGRVGVRASSTRWGTSSFEWGGRCCPLPKP